MRNRTRRGSLQSLNEWRNAIAHQDSAILAVQPLHLRSVTDWRRLCDNLAHGFDEVMRIHIGSITGCLALVNAERRLRDEVQEWQADRKVSRRRSRSFESLGEECREE